MSANSENIDAIDRYFDATPANTPAAMQAKMSWISWHNGLNFWQRHLSTSTVQEAIQRRVMFEAANGIVRPKVAEMSPVEAQYFANIPTVDVTGLTPAQAKAKVAAVNAAETKPSTKGMNLTLQYGVLRQGSRGIGVKRWQAVLVLPQTGIFDAAVTAKTKAFQASRGLKADGVVGPASWTASFTQTQAPTPTKDDSAIAVARVIQNNS